MWYLESIAERGRAMRTFVCIVPETRRRVTTDNGVSLQRRERFCAGQSIRLFQRTRAKQAYVKGDLESVMRYCTCAFRPRRPVRRGGSGGFGRTPLSAGIPLITVRKLCRTPGSFTLRAANSTWTSSRCAPGLR